MKDKSTEYQDISEKYTYFGGRGLVANILNDEVDPKCDPLGPENKFIVCNGLMVDTVAPCSGRVSIGGKSPLTGTIKEANAGGMAAKALARHNIRAIIVEDKAENNDWYLLYLDENGPQIIDAASYAGMNNYQLVEKLQGVYGSDIAVVSIGCAGERGYRNSSVQITDPDGRPSRAAARGGLGSVMGSKGLKAIIIKDSGKHKGAYQDRDNFLKENKNFVKGIQSNPVDQGMTALGTAVLVNLVNSMGILPTNNFSKGTFDDVGKLSGELLAETQPSRGGSQQHACHPGCVIKCSNVIHDAQGNYVTSGLEYETLALVGSNCGISDVDVVARIDRMCDDLGIDTMDAGCTIGVCMEGGIIEFGDCEGAIKLVQEMIEGTELGKIMGNGTEAIGRHLGVKRIPTVKGQSLAGYDPRGLKGTGVTYATCPMGADHTAGNALGNPTVDPLQKDGQVALSTNLQVGMTMFDNLGMCIFSGFCIAEPEYLQSLVNMVAAKYGGEWDVDRLMGIAVQTLSIEKTFNKNAGFTEEDDRLPDFMYTEQLEGPGTVFDITDEEMKAAIPF